MTGILGFLIAGAVGTAQQSAVFTPLAIRATTGAWIGVRNETDFPVEVCGLNVSAQARRGRGTVGRVSGLTSSVCDAFSAHFLVEPHESHLVWLNAWISSSPRVMFSVRVGVFDAMGKPSVPLGLVWHNWSDLQLEKPLIDAKHWVGSTVTHRNSKWIRVTNTTASAQAISLDEGAGQDGCSPGSQFHLVLAKESLIQGKIGERKSVTLFEADPATGKCLRAESVTLSPEAN